MQIRKLEVVNFKNIREFNAEFVQGIYLITGENDIGKSHLIQAIITLLNGQRSDNLLAKDQKTGHIKGTFSQGETEYEVSLRYDEKNPRGVLTIQSKDNALFSNQISALQKIFNYTDFDAGEFILWGKTAEGRKKQVNLVRSLMPKEVTEAIDRLNNEIAVKYTERTDLNREVKRLDSVLQGLNVTDLMRTTFKEKKDPVEISNKLQEASNLINSSAKYEADVETHMTAIAKADADIDDYEKRIIALKHDREIYKDRRDSAKALAQVDRNKLGQINIDQLNLELNSCTEHNEKVDTVLYYNTTKLNHTNRLKEAEAAETAINSIRLAVETLIKEKGKLPIPGLDFGEDGLTLNGVPFLPGEVSSSQEMEVAVRLIIASNPTTKIFKMMHGESMGNKKFEALIQFARDNNYQGFIEVVKPGQDDLDVYEYSEREG